MMRLLSLLLMLIMTGTTTDTINVSVVDQSNVVERFPNLVNRVRCQNITDIYLQPLLVAADDAVMPPRTFFQAQQVLNGLDDCSAITFAFSAIRMRSFSNPQSLTVVFMRADGAGGVPGTTLYKKTMPWATNDQQWLKDYVGLPWTYEVTLQWNELGDDGVTRLNFRNTTFLPPSQRFWLAFYCTVDQQIGSGFRLNAMYWVTLNNLTGSAPLKKQLYGLANKDFMFRDVNNLLKFGFTNWTAARAFEAVAGITPTTNNLAWRLFFTCNLSTAPTTAPTVMVPTTRPTASPTTTSPTQTPTSWPTNSSDLNATRGIGGGMKGWEIAMIIAVPMTLLLASFFIFLVVRRFHRRRAVKRADLTGKEPRRGAVLQEREHFEEYSLVSLSDTSEGATPTTQDSPLVDSVYPSVIVTTDEEDKFPAF